MNTRTSSRVVRLAIASALTALTLGTGEAAVITFSPAAVTTAHFVANNPWPNPPQPASPTI